MANVDIFATHQTIYNSSLWLLRLWQPNTTTQNTIVVMMGYVLHIPSSATSFNSISVYMVYALRSQNVHQSTTLLCSLLVCWRTKESYRNRSHWKQRQYCSIRAERKNTNESSVFTYHVAGEICAIYVRTLSSSDESGRFHIYPILQYQENVIFAMSVREMHFKTALISNKEPPPPTPIDSTLL